MNGLGQMTGVSADRWSWRTASEASFQSELWWVGQMRFQWPPRRSTPIPKAADTRIHWSSGINGLTKPVAASAAPGKARNR